MMAKGEDEMRSMVEKLEGYLDRKGLEVNTEKIKILRFRRRRMSKKDWKWKGKRLEKVKEFICIWGI